MIPTKQMNQLLPVLISYFMMIAGCQSTGMERSNATRISLQTMDNDITTAVLQLDATGAALGDPQACNRDIMQKQEHKWLKR